MGSQIEIQNGIQPSLNDLAAQIQSLTQTFTKYLQENNIPEPTHAADSPTSYSGLDGATFVLRQELYDKLMDMIYLTQGTSESIFNYVHTSMPNVATLNILNQFDFWGAVPVDGSASYDDIARHTQLPAVVCQRLVDHATTLRLFTTSSPGNLTATVRHTSRSAAMAKSSGLRALATTILDETGPPMAVVPEALRRYTQGKSELSKSMNETAFALFHQSETFGRYANSWEMLENDGEGEHKGWRQRNFVEFMRYLKEIFQYEKVMLEAYDWKSAGNISVVDVGGSGGHDSVVLAQNFPDLRVTVQDLGEARSEFDKNLPVELKDRVSFAAHNFFDPQTTKADIFLLKLILHDWPDKESKQILRNLIPGMEPGSKILFIDYVGGQGEKDEAAPEIPRSMRAFGTATDVRMMALFNHRERAVEEWKKLFEAVDPRLEVARVASNPISFNIIIEAVWKGE